MPSESCQRTLTILAGVAALSVSVACGGGGYGSSPTPVPSATPGTSTPADVTITINGMLGSGSYTPNPAAVKVGQTVAWRNADVVAHTATGAGFDTGTIAAGQTSRLISFATAGTIGYHCSIHPTMVGTLNVTS